MTSSIGVIGGGDRLIGNGARQVIQIDALPRQRRAADPRERQQIVDQLAHAHARWP